MKKMVFLLVVLIMTSLSMCKSAEWTAVSGGQLTIQSSSNSPFPHPQRAQGHIYNDIQFSFEEHYNDSSVAIFIPDHFVQTETMDLVFYFHGWGNSIQESMEKFELLQQFSGSKTNAVFVFPQGPKNASDSFGGRLEEPGIFKALVEDVLAFLQQEKKIKILTPGKIILAGHSGAYRVISFILNRGGLTENISEVYLFDALYGQVENYTHWLEKYEGRLINITTPNGGTMRNGVDLMDDLDDWGMPNQRIEKDTVSVEELRSVKIVSIFTTMGHSEVINPFFKLSLMSSGLQKLD
ncbi:MAG: hypothetical protein H8E26_03295 [FCB group bacterium]|nr:hypothetical protein [FCB group bacterium]MBL7026966.1 hypothetical protein [Candidatus Neomarinimicrobiota bacterium]MBL7122146.1 hypothetical protein [Candidatus Neomarinimicrobiota bacterium]